MTALQITDHIERIIWYLMKPALLALCSLSNITAYTQLLQLTELHALKSHFRATAYHR